VNISGLIVYAQPAAFQALRARLAEIPGVEVHATTAEGRMVVTVERPTDGEMTTTSAPTARRCALPTAAATPARSATPRSSTRHRWWIILSAVRHRSSAYRSAPFDPDQMASRTRD
jgi:hypothetical protein